MRLFKLALGQTMRLVAGRQWWVVGSLLDDVVDEYAAAALGHVQSSLLSVDGHLARLLESMLVGVEKVSYVTQVGVEQLHGAVVSVQHVDESVVVQGDVDQTVGLAGHQRPASVTVRHRRTTRPTVYHLHNRTSSVNFAGQDIFARKCMYENLIKCAAKTGFESQSYIPRIHMK